MSHVKCAARAIAAKAMLHSVTLIASLAFSPIARSDRLEITGIVGGDNVVVMMDGRRSPGAQGCENDIVFRTTGSVDIPRGNVLAAAGCRSEIAVFSSDNAMFLGRVDGWTNDPDDVIQIHLKPVIKVPVSIWLEDPADEQTARTHLQRMNVLYRMNRVGVRFIASIQPVPAAALNAVKNGFEEVTRPDGSTVYSCKDLTDVQQSAAYTSGRLNVYYLKRPIGGRNCAILQTPVCSRLDDFPEGDGNITYIGRSADRSTLAHEIGHAFGLRPGPCGGHPTVEDDGITSRNIMADDSDGDSDRFTLGQVFRMNTHTDQWGGTMLIKNGLRSAPVRACPPRKNSGACPALKRDWRRP